MFTGDLFTRRSADIGNLTASRDVPALIHLLDSNDPQIRRRAHEALITLGPGVLPLLEKALFSPQARIRLGAVEVLGGIRDTAAIPPLKDLLPREKRIELRYAIILALGEIGSPDCIPGLIPLLQDTDKFIRFGAAVSLDRLGWEPSDQRERIMYHIAVQDWDEVRAAGPAALVPLTVVSSGPDPLVRARVASLLGEIGAVEGGLACERGLRDSDPHVRWAAVLAAMDCGIRPSRLPPFVAARERTGPDPLAAAILNFLFLGIGYNYIGKWWGFPVFMTYMTIMVFVQLYTGMWFPYIFVYPFTAISAVQTYYAVKRMPDM